MIRGIKRIPPAWNQRAGWEKALLTVFALLLLALFLRAVCPQTDGDALTYHLTAAYRYLQNGKFVFLPTIVHTNWPLGVEMLYALLLGISQDAPPAAAHFALGLVALCGCYALGARIAGSFAGACAATSLLLHKGFWNEFALAYVDLGMAASATLAAACLVISRDEAAGRRRWTALAAIFAGLAATSKLTGVWVIVSLSLVILISDSGDRQPLRVRIREAARFAASAGCVVLPWFIKTWALTGNPVYPAFFSTFGGKEWTAGGYARLHEFYLRLNTPPGYPPSPAVLWLTHTALTGLGIVIAAFTFLFTRRSEAAIPARMAAFFTALVWTFSIFNLRFLMAATPSLAVSLTHRLAARQKQLSPVVTILAVILAARLAWSGVDPDLPTAARVAFGVTDSRTYQRRHVLDYDLMTYANQRLPSDSVILASALAHNTALYRARVLAGDYWTQDSIHYDSAERMEADLRRLGVTHLVLQTRYPEWCSRSAVCGSRLSIEQAALLKLAQKRGERLLSTEFMSLYRLKLPPESNP